MERWRPGVSAAGVSCRSFFPWPAWILRGCDHAQSTSARTSGQQMNGGGQAIDGLLKSAGSSQGRQVLIESLLESKELLFPFLQLTESFQRVRQAGREFGKGITLFATGVSNGVGQGGHALHQAGALVQRMLLQRRQSFVMRIERGIESRLYPLDDLGMLLLRGSSLLLAGFVER